MKNKFVFSYLILTSMLFLLSNSVFALVPGGHVEPEIIDDYDEDSGDDITFTIPEYVNITIDSSSVLSGTATATSETSLSLNSPLTAIFNIVSSDTYGDDIAFTATAVVDNNTYKLSDLTKDEIIFTKSDGSATSNAFDNALSSSASAANNANVIVFPIQCTDSKGYDGYKNNGDNTVYFSSYHTMEGGQITCTIDGSSKSGTFGMNDKTGNYSATLIVTRGWIN